ncbi:hypothetical protein OSI26_18285, partial [Mycobacterium ulcerans]
MAARAAGAASIAYWRLTGAAAAARNLLAVQGAGAALAAGASAAADATASVTAVAALTAVAA